MTGRFWQEQRPKVRQRVAACVVCELQRDFRLICMTGELKQHIAVLESKLQLMDQSFSAAVLVRRYQLICRSADTFVYDVIGLVN